MISPKELEYIKRGRYLARTDLKWLCQKVLNRAAPYHIFQPGVHDKMVEHLQKFDVQGEDRLIEGRGFEYFPPGDPNLVLTGSRRRLLLAPRGWFKTSYNVIAHTIQWILNYPDVTVLIVHASQEVAEHMIIQIKNQFQANPVMRYFFPEFCPSPSVKEWGTRQYFSTPARTVFTMAPTVSVGGIESIRTGMHYHVLKFTDIVDEKNSSTREQCKKIIYSYGMCRNLLISPSYWIDIEGTRYDFGDLYGRVVDEWLTEPEDGKTFQIFTMGCYHKDLNGKVERFTPDELSAPYLLDAAGHKISRFPNEFPLDKLEAMRKDPVTGEQLFCSQQLNDPTATEDTQQPFPLKYLRWKTGEELKKIPMQYYITTIDTAEKVTDRSDYTAIVTCGWDRYGRCYVVDVRLGKYLPEEIVEHVFGVHQKYKPVKILVEETGFVRGLQPSVARVRDTLGIYPNFEFIPRDTLHSKAERILGLQPFYKNGMIYFSKDLTDFVKDQLQHQLSRFPKYQHDDLLDALADQLQHKQFFGVTKPAPSEREIMERAQEAMIYKKQGYEALFGEQTDATSTMYDGLGAL